MTACWQALSELSGIEVSVVALPSNRPWRPGMFDGIDWLKVLTEEEAANASFVVDTVRQTKPEVLVVSGWATPLLRQIAKTEFHDVVARVLAFDTPWRGCLRQRVGQPLLRWHARNFDAAVVAGERGLQYASRLGFDPAAIMVGTYGIDFVPFAEVAKERSQMMPRRFLFVGRYAPEKGIEFLLEAYDRYRQLVSDPWPLQFVGSGPLEPAIEGNLGLENLGFVQPDTLPQVFAECGAFVLPSLYEPWGAVIAEAAAAGLPVLATNACGATTDLIHHTFNGYRCAPADVESLVRGLIWAHESHDSLYSIGQRAHQVANAYSAESWASRWQSLISELHNSRKTPSP